MRPYEKLPHLHAKSYLDSQKLKWCCYVTYVPFRWLEKLAIVGGHLAKFSHLWSFNYRHQSHLKF